MNIITVSREYGSGGRYLGQKIAEFLGYDYYDREIIVVMAKAQGVDANFLDKMLVNHQWNALPFLMKKGFGASASIKNNQVSYLVKEKEIILGIAEKGRNCVIVGRNADWYLKEYHPMNIFVCASMESKIKRCMEREDKNLNLDSKEIEKIIRSIDRNRSMAREVIAGNVWGYKTTYHLTVNTTEWNLDKLAKGVASFAIQWFE